MAWRREAFSLGKTTLLAEVRPKVQTPLKGIRSPVIVSNHVVVSNTCVIAIFTMLGTLDQATKRQLPVDFIPS